MTDIYFFDRVTRIFINRKIAQYLIQYHGRKLSSINKGQCQFFFLNLVDFASPIPLTNGFSFKF